MDKRGSGWMAWIVSALLAAAAGAQSADPVTLGITQPADRLRLSLPFPGIVREVTADEGQPVKAGDVIVALDDEIDRLELRRLELEASSTARLEALQADLDQKRVELRRVERIQSGGGMNELEVERARLDVLVAEKQLKVAEDERTQAGLRAQQQAKKVRELSLRSPIEGVVQTITIKQGEYFQPDPDAQAAVVVSNNPLKIEVDKLSPRQVALLRVGQTMDVRYPDDPQGQWRAATLYYISPVANYASDTQLLKLRMPNPEGRTSGLEVQVRLPPAVAEASATFGPVR